MTAKIIRPKGSDATHRVQGSAPGWADCTAWVQGGEEMPPGTPIDCSPCAASAARENA